MPKAFLLPRLLRPAPGAGGLTYASYMPVLYFFNCITIFFNYLTMQLVTRITQE